MTKPDRNSEAQAVLGTLVYSYPHGVSSPRLQAIHGPAAKSRIGDLRDQGYSIATSMEGGIAYYRLTSMEPNAEQAKARRIVQRGVKVVERLDGSVEVTAYGTAEDAEGSEWLATKIEEFLAALLPAQAHGMSIEEADALDSYMRMDSLPDFDLDDE